MCGIRYCFPSFFLLNYAGIIIYNVGVSQIINLPTTKFPDVLRYPEIISVIHWTQFLRLFRWKNFRKVPIYRKPAEKLTFL